MDFSLCIEDRLTCVHKNCKVSSCENEVQFRHDFIVGADGLCIFCDIGTQACKDYLYLFLLFAVKFFQVIIQFYNRHWFDEQGRARGRLIVD